MKNIGIWLDKEKALIVTIKESFEELETVNSDIEVFRPSGGSGTKSAKWGPQDVVQDSKFLEREKHQYKSYFKNLIGKIKKGDSIALFGPAESATKFKKELDINYPLLAAKIKTVKKVDSMTNNQVKKMVREFFGKPAY
ncbi:hypothetical protein [Maribacter sp. HTCC2170]|uniref:hypothetical protein n=1 Tax=Maribacter sp. (strain HTCC2170 / KCCM 42371) TaxID=313603 RepID=UPI00006B4871|nr:hypothetical protein [Maribacter sp. HTCC2170]EAR01738.1 hypothetical protein FB2170_14458 [Maribacter sp. HTCC2170]